VFSVKVLNYDVEIFGRFEFLAIFLANELSGSWKLSLVEKFLKGISFQV